MFLVLLIGGKKFILVLITEEVWRPTCSAFSAPLPPSTENKNNAELIFSTGSGT
jgi:hypothetical protein